METTVISEAIPVHPAASGSDCVHRPEGEVQSYWADGRDRSTWVICSCCRVRSLLEATSKGRCRVCDLGLSYRRGSGHLVRLALDLGARPLVVAETDWQLSLVNGQSAAPVAAA